MRVEEHPDALGRESIFAVTSLNNDRWFLIFQQEMADAFSTWNTTKAIAILLFILWALVVATFTFFVSRRMTLRVEEVLIQKEKMSNQVVEAGRLASIGELAAGIAHEINNPVAIMVEEAGWIQDLLEDEDLAQTENKAEFERALQQIKNQGKRCKEITHKLLSFARKTDSRVEAVAINDLLEEMVSLSAQRARYSKVTIETDLAEELPPLHISQTELQQVFLNLINNALDAMNQTGGSLKISTHLADDKILIEVADTGPGIPRANLAHIFDPFFTTKPVGKGTGLGLSICYGIIKKMGGEIDVNSVVDMGTTFRIQLPVRPKPEGAGQPAA